MPGYDEDVHYQKAPENTSPLPQKDPQFFSPTKLYIALNVKYINTYNEARTWKTIVGVLKIPNLKFVGINSSFLAIISHQINNEKLNCRSII